MISRITYWIIAGVLVGIIVLGVLLILSLTKRDSADISSQSILGTKEIKIEEVNSHSTADKCWTIVGGNVYDATNVIKDNPTYSTTLIKACGADGGDIYVVKKFTKQELDVEVINKLYQQLQQKRIGVLAP